MNRDYRGDNRPRETRINERVRAREVRLIDEEGEMLGVMPSGQALALARERGLDLVEVSPMAAPPVCKLLDYGRFKYDQAKRESEARKHQKTSELKEIRMRPRTDDHDLEVKVRKMQEFLADGDKVKVGVIFRGREMAHPELGRQLLEKVIVELKTSAVIERPPIMEGKMVSMIISRAPGWEPQKRTAPATRDRKGATDSTPMAPAQPEMVQPAATPAAQEQPAAEQPTPAPTGQERAAAQTAAPAAS